MRRAVWVLLIAACADDRAAAQQYARQWCVEHCGEPSRPGCGVCADRLDAGSRGEGGGGGGTGGGGASGGGPTGGSGEMGGGAGGGGGGASGLFLPVQLLGLPDAGLPLGSCERAVVMAVDITGSPQPESFEVAADAGVLFTDPACSAVFSKSSVSGSLDVYVKEHSRIGPLDVLISASPPATSAVTRLFPFLQAMVLAATDGGCASLKISAVLPATPRDERVFSTAAPAVRIVWPPDAGGGAASLMGPGCDPTAVVGAAEVGGTYWLRPAFDELLIEGDYVRRVSVALSGVGTAGVGAPCTRGNDCASRLCAAGHCLCSPPGAACTAQAGNCCTTASPACAMGRCQ